MGNLNRSKNHPDNRAILYEEKTYSKRKILDFLSILNSFRSVLSIVELFNDTDSSLLERISRFQPVGQYPDYNEELAFFKV